MHTASLLTLSVALALSGLAQAGEITRLTPPSELFTSGQPAPVIARFLPGQKFDLQATVQPDPGTTIVEFQFLVDGRATATPAYELPNGVTVPAQNLDKTSAVTETGGSGCIDATGRTSGAAGCVLARGLRGNTTIVSQRGYALSAPGLHELKVIATQSDGRRIEARGNFEIVGIAAGDTPIRNIIIMFGDGMGAAHRTAARIVSSGYAQGKARAPLAMDTFSNTAMVMTASLNSIVTDSAPGMQNYVTGNKVNNNEEGVFPDDTRDPFDNPRIQYLSEYLHASKGKALGIVTTADVFDATPASNAIHTAARGNGTGIVDQYLDDRHLTGLRVLLGGGRKWFLPNVSDSISPQPANGSQRRGSNDYVLPPDVVRGWNASPGKLDPARDLIADFEAAGFGYAHDRESMQALVEDGPAPDRLLGLFAYSNMNVAYDKLAGRRGDDAIVEAYGFPDQPMLEEMTEAALKVLAKSPNGFVLTVEAASIDKQSHLMDSERWILDVIELDRATAVAKRFAEQNPGTLVIVTADHECAGAAIIGTSTLSAAQLDATPGAGKNSVALYEAAGFPRYTIAADGYPQTTHVDRKMLIGYGANADRYETWKTTAFPTADSQQPFSPSASPANPSVRNEGSGYLITGHIAGNQAAHTASDIPLSAHGPGATLFNGVIDNTDVFFKLGQLGVAGTPR